MGRHAGKVTADGPLPFAARVHHPAVGIVGVGTSGRTAGRCQSRSGGFRRGQRGHLAKQITEIVHGVVAGFFMFYCFLENMSLQQVFLIFLANRGSNPLISNSHDDLATRQHAKIFVKQLAHYQQTFPTGYHNNWRTNKRSIWGVFPKINQVKQNLEEGLQVSAKNDEQMSTTWVGTGLKIATFISCRPALV